MVTDPVCLKQLDEQKTFTKAEYRGQTYYFDSDHCREVFESDPAEYAGVIPTITYGDQGERYPNK